MSLADTMNNTVERGTPVDYTRCLVYFGPSVVDEMNAEAAGADASSGAPSDAEAVAGRVDAPRYAVATAPVDMMAESSKDVITASSDQIAQGAPAEQPFDLASIAGDYVQVDGYDSTPLGAEHPVVTLKQLCDAVGMELPSGVDASSENSLGLIVMTESNYNAYLRFRGMEPIELGEDGYTILSDMGATVNDIYNKVLSEGVELQIGGRTLHPAQNRVPEDASTFQNAMMGMNSGTIVLPDDLVASLNLVPYYSYLLLNYADDVSVEQGDAYVEADRTYADITNADGAVIAGWGVEATRTTTYESVDSMTGLISYLAIYIGFVLVVACAAILTIQQLSGVADATRNYRILAELGTSRREISHSLLAQQAVFFIFPLLVGTAHAACALSVIIELVALFGGLTIGGTVGLTGAIFLVAYGGYFCVTYVMSKGIVRDAARVRHEA